MQDIDQNEIKKPMLLKVLVILSAVYMALSVLGNVGALIRGPFTTTELNEAQVTSLEQIEQMKSEGLDRFAEIMEESLQIQFYVNDNHYLNSILSLLILGIGIYGIILMSKAHKRGFHLYIVYSLLSSLLVYVSVPVALVPLVFLLIGLGVSGLFVLLYSRTLSYMIKV